MSNFVEYKDCTVLCKLNKSKEQLISKVPIDEFTNEVQNNFDYDFTGESKFYPYELPKEVLDLDFNILAIVGASGKGKSTLLKEFENNREYKFANKQYDSSKAIVSNFNTPRESEDKLNAVGLTSIPVWCRPRNVLSVGEGFRADVALNLNSYTLFDEFTSTIDRNVAKATSNGLQKYIRRNGLDHIVFCSCHKDYIPYLKPDIVIDLDEEKVFDCRGFELGETLASKSIKQTTKRFGGYLGNFTI